MLAEGAGGTPGRPAADGRIWFVQMVRGIALVLVIVQHLVIGFWLHNELAAGAAHTRPLAAGTDTLLFLRPFEALHSLYVSVGTVAIAGFFLISGFVIPLSLERYRPVRYFVARFFRIWPTWLACLAVTLATLAVYARYADQPFPYSADVAIKNASLLPDWFLAPYINPVAWTLTVELKFYVLCGLLAWGGALIRPGPILATSGVLTALAGVAYGDYQRLLAEDSALAVPALIVGLNGRYITFMFLGVTAYNLFRGHWDLRRALLVGGGLVAMFAAGTVFGPDLREWKIATLVSFGLGLVWFCAFYAWKDRLPFSRPIDFLADVSYPYYALHYVVGFVLLTVLYDAVPSPYVALPLAIAAVTGLAYLVHRLVERPANRFGKVVRLPRRRVREGPVELVEAARP